MFIFHTQQWARITSYHSLQWSDFPWPVLNFLGPRDETELKREAVVEYVRRGWEAEGSGKPLAKDALAKGKRDEKKIGKSPLANQNAKETEEDAQEKRDLALFRLREHIKRWSPETFEKRFLRLVPEEKGERAKVKRGAEMVVKWLKEVEKELA